MAAPRDLTIVGGAPIPHPVRPPVGISRRAWWIGVGIVAGALVFHALWPRYEWHARNYSHYVSFDRWTGEAQLLRYPGIP